MVGWLVFIAYQPLQVIQWQIHLYTNSQFYFKQFSLASVHSLIVKNISISNYSVYSNSFNSANFVYTLLNVKIVLYIKIQFSVSTVLMSKTVPFQTIQFSISTKFKCKYSLIVKNISISSYSV